MATPLEAYYYFVNGDFVHNVYHDKISGKVYIIKNESRRILLDVNHLRAPLHIRGDELLPFGTLSELTKGKGSCRKAKSSSYLNLRL